MFDLVEQPNILGALIANDLPKLLRAKEQKVGSQHGGRYPDSSFFTWGERSHSGYSFFSFFSGSLDAAAEFVSALLVTVVGTPSTRIVEPIRRGPGVLMGGLATEGPGPEGARTPDGGAPISGPGMFMAIGGGPPIPGNGKDGRSGSGALVGTVSERGGREPAGFSAAVILTVTFWRSGLGVCSSTVTTEKNPDFKSLERRSATCWPSRKLPFRESSPRRVRATESKRVPGEAESAST